MEDEPEHSERITRRSMRTRTQARVTGTTITEDELEGEREDVSDDFEEPRRKAKRSRVAEGASTSAHTLDQSLIEVIKGDGKEIPDVVKRWVERYEGNPKSAMAELLTMLFEACGAKYCLQEEHLDEMSVDDVVVTLVNLARKGEVEDYQNSKREFKNFKDNLVYFWDNLVSECQNGALFDQILFDKCLDYIIALSCTPPRVYRLVASLMGLQLVTSFINVAKMLGAQRETTQRQLNAEKKKRADGPRVESLNKRLSTTHEKITVTEEMMRKLFTGLFVHRYRDIDPDIRISCIESLGVWVQSYPSLFLQDLYLKYLGWTLNDKVAGVRKASVLALQNLYEVEDNVPSLNLFTERFYKRMLELADDIDISVAVCAIGLVKQLLRHQLVPDEELGSLYDLLIDDPPDIRHAIGALVYDHLIAQKFNDSQSRSTGNDSDSSEVLLSRMLQILKEFSADPILSLYVIDDVWDYMGAMKDWKCIIGMLLEDNPSTELNDVDATNLIRLLSASIRKAVGERIVPATDNRKQHFTKAQKETFESNRRDITNAMMKNYPQLLHKFMADKEKVAPLVEVIVHINLELYSLKSKEQNFKAVLQLVKAAFFKHGEKDALRSCVKAVKFCATESRGELQDFARNQIKELEDELIAKLKSAIKDVVNGDDEYSLLVNLKRLYELQLLWQVPIGSLYGDFGHILQRFRSIDEEVITFLLLNMYLHVAWCLHSIISSETVSELSISSLVLEKRTVLFEQLEYFLCNPPKVDGGSGYQLACRVCSILAELWCLFKKGKFASTKLEILGYCPDESTIQKYWKLCEQLLNVSDEIEDEDGSKEYIEDTNRDTVILAATKLIANDSVPMEYLGPEIISRFGMYGTSVTEIIKHLITALRKKIDDVSNIFLEALKRVRVKDLIPEGCFGALCLQICIVSIRMISVASKFPSCAVDAQQNLLFLLKDYFEYPYPFNEPKRSHQRYLLVVSSSNDKSLSSKSFQECQDLASRLSGSYVGAARNKHKSEILNIIREGINYAFFDAPKQLSFLDGVVLHFVSKLPTPDILDTMKGVEKRAENVKTDQDPSGWRPYHVFLESLQEKYAKNEGLQDKKEGVTVRRRGRPRKKQNIQGKRLFDEQPSSEEEDSISGSDQDAEDEDQKQIEEEDDAPLIHSLRSSSKLRSLKVPREDYRNQQKNGDSGRATENLDTSRTSGASE